MSSGRSRPRSHRRERLSGRDPYSADSHSRDSYDRELHGEDPHRADPYGADPYGEDPYGEDPYGADPYGADPYGEQPRRGSARTLDPYARHRYDRDPFGEVPRRLYRDPAREKIGGVCAGIARYYGVEPWVVRCIAVTGLLFFPTIVFPAYWVAYFVMDKPPKAGEEHRGDGGRRRRRRRRHRAEPASADGRYDHRSPAPELGPRFSPRHSLRNVRADLTEVELRLRRMETHVTSGRYELQRELNRIERG